MSEDNKETKPITYLIPHTHWDREWYVPFQVYRFRLVEAIDELLEILEQHPEFKYFNMDGQTIVLEDYLEIKPENREKLANFIKMDKIGIGPWYVQCSPWLQTGEGIVRNLLFGEENCNEFQVKAIQVGWVPDQFIHPPQFPQIYQGFGITHTAFSRGIGNIYEENPNLTCEFKWQGLDSSEVIAFHLKEGYGLCANLDKEPFQALNMVALDVGKISSMKWSTHLRLGFNGSDHSRPDEVLLDVIDIWDQEDDLIEELGKIKIASWKEFINDFQTLKPNLETVRGELSGRKYSVTFHDVFSSYMPLKQQSFRIHDILERWSEPFSVFSHLNGLLYMNGFIKTAWKWLLKNQAHDSSWTSSLDQIEKEMEVRYDWAEQIGVDTYRRSLQWIAQRIELAKNKDCIPIVVFNPHPWERNGIIIARFANKFGAFQLLNEEGNEVTCQYEPSEKSHEDRERRRVFVGSHGPVGENFVNIKFVAEKIPPLGYKTYSIKKRDPKRKLDLPDEGLLDGNDFYLENEIVKIVVERDGTFTLMHRIIEEDENEEKIIAMGEELTPGSIWAKEIFNTFKGLHLFENSSEIGDGWESIQIKEDKPIITAGKLIKTELIDASDFQGVLKVEKTIKIPKSINESYNKRSTKIVELPITVYITLQKGFDPVVRFRTIITNSVKDHKLRIVFPTNLETSTVEVNGHFGVHSRNIKKPNGDGWHRPPQGIFPFHKWISTWDKKKKQGLAIITRGLPEYEAIHSKENDKTSIFLTLFRSFARWGSHIGIKNPTVFTPKAQLLDKTMEFEYAIVPLQSNWNEKNQKRDYLYRLAEEYYTPLRYEENYDVFRYQISNEERILPNSQGFIEVCPENIIMSSVKGIQKWDNENPEFIIRVYNIFNKISECKLRFDQKLKEFEFVDLSEKPLNTQLSHKFDENEQILSFDIGGCKIQTIKLKFESF